MPRLQPVARPGALFASARSTCWLLLGTAILSGCAGGQVWVADAGQPVPSSARSASTDLPTEPPTATETADGDSDRTGRWRVITLGQRVEVPADSSGAGESSPRAALPPTVVVNNYYPSASGYGYGYGYAGSGFWLGSGSGRPDHGHGPHPEPFDRSAPRVGGNWTAPPDHGPPVMTHTAPANPWR